MQELVGRLTALDPEASETLKVVSYFDTLVAGGVGLESLLRGAAVLSGAVAGFAPSGAGQGRRVGPDGESLGGDQHAQADAAASAWPSRATSDGSLVWLERTGHAHANDAMVLERLALAVAITTARRSGTADAAVEVVVTAGAAASERAVAASRLRLDCASDVRVVAFHAAQPAPVAGPTAVVATARGLARVVLVEGTVEVPSGVRAGVGTPGTADRLPESFASALIALRLATDSEPVVDASQLGALLFVAEAADRHEHPHPDAAALAALDSRARSVLDALADAGSVRQAASALGMHHSSVQARLDALAETLGYDSRTPAGRTRYALARALAALQRPGLG
ncbi:helix-turn-helix domain-containing protein [Agromyces sp. NPDC058110]|uniref:helix-turn-helix domain-containing protein n=1 Tax=Agromyces sp. NPDC058110 TaxID=3346345 RepID=UPI0036D78264